MRIELDLPKRVIPAKRLVVNGENSPLYDTEKLVLKKHSKLVLFQRQVGQCMAYDAGERDFWKAKTFDQTNLLQPGCLCSYFYFSIYGFSVQVINTPTEIIPKLRNASRFEFTHGQARSCFSCEVSGLPEQPVRVFPEWFTEVAKKQLIERWSETEPSWPPGEFKPDRDQCRTISPNESFQAQIIVNPEVDIGDWTPAFRVYVNGIFWKPW